ncbi:MAG: amino acid kinase family protein [Promethearchaeota archaeon]
MEHNNILVKIGGKILESPANLNITISEFRNLISLQLVNNIIIIPGGGSLANFIRIADKTLKLGEDLSHWLAILAMHYNAKRYFIRYSDIKYIENYNELKSVMSNKSGKILVFGLYNYLRNEDSLPHNWNVTSDSIAYFIAERLNLKDVYLIKDIDGIFLVNQEVPIEEVSIKELKSLIKRGKLNEFKSSSHPLKKSTPIDSYVLNLIAKYGLNCIILNGTVSKRISNFFIPNKKKMYTLIKSN